MGILIVEKIKQSRPRTNLRSAAKVHTGVWHALHAAADLRNSARAVGVRKFIVPERCKARASSLARVFAFSVADARGYSTSTDNGFYIYAFKTN